MRAHTHHSRFMSKCMFMAPQILAWPFWPLLYSFLAVPPQSPSPARSSCSLYSSTNPLSSETLRFAFLSVAKSWFRCSFLMAYQLARLTRLFLVTVSITFVCQVYISQFCLLLPHLLVIPFCIENVFDQMTLKNQMLSPST